MLLHVCLVRNESPGASSLFTDAVHLVAVDRVHPRNGAYRGNVRK